VADSEDIHFDGWTLKRASGELTRDGKLQRLPPQPLAMLIELIENAGQVVTRERLVQVLWPRGIVDFDNSLNAVVRKLRVTLGDDSATPRYIETLPRIGYRFIGTAEAPPLPDARPAVVGTPPSHRWLTRRHVFVVVLAAAGLLFWFLRAPPQPSVISDAAPSQTPKRTTSERAYDLYLQGIFNRSRRDINGNKLALANFEAALKEDPYYADAWAALAETFSGSAMSMNTPVTPTYEQARSAALRAIELDDNLGHAHAALGHIVLQYDRDFPKAEAELEKARVLDDRYARTWHTLGILRAFQGRMPEALDAVRRARELEPMTLLYNANYGLLLYYARRYDDAIAHVKPLLAAQSRFDQARSVLIRALVAEGNVEAALEQLPLRVSDRPTISDAGLVYAHAGRVADARAEIERIRRMGTEGYGVEYDVAVIEAALGRRAAACEALEKSLGDHSLSLPWMRADPRMDPLRQEPCYVAIFKRLYGGS